MLKKSYLLLLIWAPLMLAAQTDQTQLDIWPKFKEASYASKKVKGHDFKVILTDLKDTQVILGYHQSNKQYVRDTAEIDKNGVAHFAGTEDWDGGIYLIAVGGVSIFEFVYSGTEKGFTLTTDTKNALKNLKIKNSPENELFIGYQNERIKRGMRQQSMGERYKVHKKENNKDSMQYIEDLSGALSESTKNYQIKLSQEHPGTMVAMIVNLMREPEVPEPPATVNGEPVDTAFWQYIYYKRHYWDYVDFTDDRILRTPIFRNRVAKFIGKNITVQQPDSICETAQKLIDVTRESNKEVYKNVLTWTMSKYEKSNIMGMNAVVCCLGQKYYLNDPEVDWLKEKKRQKFVDHVAKECNVVIGKQAKELVMKDMSGTPKSLHAVDADYTVIYFYSATCGHCKKTTPKVKKVYDDFRAKGVKVYAVNVDYKDVKNDEGQVINRLETKEYHDYVNKNKFDWINVADPLHQTKFRDHYNIYSTPVTYLVDKNKMFLGVRLDPNTLRRILMHEIEGMSHEEIEKWMNDNGYIEEEKEEGEDHEGHDHEKEEGKTQE